MSRLINADELMAYIERVLPEWSEDKEVCMDCLMNSPTVDAVTVVHGKWVKSGRWGRVYRCDQCGNYLDFDGVNVGRGDANYCPNCGARMDAEVNHDK